MSNGFFDLSQLDESIDFEAKYAGGKDGKGQLPKSLFETYSAFANSQGGVILLGAKELKDGSLEATGIPRVDQVIDDLWNALNNPQKVSSNLLADNEVTKLSLENGRFLVSIKVPRAPRALQPVFINGNPLSGTYKRQATGDFHCKADEVKRMLAEQTEDSRDARLLTQFDINDINLESLQAYRNQLASLKPGHPFNDQDNVEFLRQLGGWKRDRSNGSEGLTVAGLLMFGKELSIREVYEYYFVDYRELPASGERTKWVDRLVADGTWSGNLYDFYRRAYDRLTRDIKVPFTLSGDTRTDDTLMHQALRECLVNTIIHADYSVRTSLLIVKAPEMFGFRNPGRMRIPISSALEGGHSDCRNRFLQRMFSLIGLGEQAGSGIPRIRQHWTSLLYREPELWEQDQPAESTLVRLRMVSLLPGKVLKGLQDQFSIHFSRLDEHERLAMATAAIEGFTTNARLQQIMSQHPSDITQLLQKLVDLGLLIRDGKARGATYRVAGKDTVDLHEQEVSFGGLMTSSGGLQDSSGGLEENFDDLEREFDDKILIAIAEPVANMGKASKEVVRNTILQLCKHGFLSTEQLARFLSRNADFIRKNYIKPMIDEGLLERRFPHEPSHERQAYRARSDVDQI